MPFYIDIAIILALILLNAFFALAELAIISSRKGRLQRLANAGNRRARVALALAEKPSLFLSSVQVGVTLVGVLVGAFGGATLADPLAGTFGSLHRSSPAAAHTLAFIIVVALTTYVTVVIGELVPKRVALSNPERWALRVAPSMRGIARFTAPLVAVLTVSSNPLVRLLRVPRIGPPVSDEEVSLLFEEGIAAGVFEPAEKEIVERLFRLSDRRVNAVMTPRTEVVWIDVEATPAEVADILVEHPFTVYPVCRGDLDHVLGVVMAAELATELLRDRPVHLRELLRPALTLFEAFRALPAIERLKESGAYLAVVVDEYGGTEGILTLTDIFESLIGELPSLESPEIARRPDGTLLVDGLLPIDELKALLAVPALPREDEGYQTLAGLLITNLDRIPHLTDCFEWDGYRFEVVDMDGTRVDQVLITPIGEQKP